MKINKHIIPALLIILTPCLPQFVSAFIDENTKGIEIMEAVYERHQQFPYIYEEQSMVMEDRNGKRDSRKVRRYTRVEEDGTVNYLLLFDHPEEVKGVALIAQRTPEGDTTKHIYLPAYGEQLIESMGEGSNDNFLGTDFSVENLTGENLSEYHYERRNNKQIDDENYYVVDVYEASDRTNSKLLRRHFIRQDNLYITLTHHYDKQGRVSKLQSHHDLKSVDGDMWRANMILIEDKKEQHQSLIKISKRVFSRDYVPAEIFTANWLYTNFPYIEPVIETEEIDQISVEESTE